VARNRKRAKERRARRPQPVVARVERDEDAPPSALEHAAPDAELAEAQLALGRPDLAEPGFEEDGALDEPIETAPDELEEAPLPGVGGTTPHVQRGAAAGLTVGDAATPQPRTRHGNRLITFLQGSWRELQRVQWPDRRQVIQATGVVIGFVIVAGLFLGLADTVSSHLVNLILNGHW
jgi:preprotein translocase subunit SecE